MIYLDFDGHTITGTAWNASKGVDPVNVSAYDTDGDPATFSTAEQDVVHEVWARVAEDYAAFDVDVTTQEPPQEAIDRAGAADEQYGTRVLIDPDTWYQSGCGCGGVAYVGVYDRTTQHDYYQPALVFTKGVGTGAKNLAEAASHEAGHNVGLGHDGTASTSGLAATTPRPRAPRRPLATSTSSWTCWTARARSLPQPTQPQARVTPVRRPAWARVLPALSSRVRTTCGSTTSATATR